MKKTFAGLVVVGLGFVGAGLPAPADSSNAELDARLNAATRVINELMATPDKSIPDVITGRAACVAVVPSTKKGAFVVGGEYGQGVATCHTRHGWSAPVFFRIAGDSFGFQIGGQATDLVLVAVNRKGFEVLLKNKATLGHDAVAVAGPVGRNAQAGTDWGPNAELLTYSLSKGLFAGLDLTGDNVSQNLEDTRTFYNGAGDSFESILTGNVAVPESAKPFVRTVAKYFRSNPASASKDYSSIPNPAPPPQARRPPAARPGGPAQGTPPPFPWPPPQPSAQLLIPQSAFMHASTMGDESSQLATALFSKGYAEISYWGVPDGIAVVTRLEHISPDGTASPNGRWNIGEDTTTQTLSIGDYIRRLFGVDKGFYRVIVFVITDLSFASSGQTPTKSESTFWLFHGLQTLPPAQAAIRIKPGYACTALIYEFQKTHAQPAKLLLPSDLGAQQHMIASGLWSALGGVSK